MDGGADVMMIVVNHTCRAMQQSFELGALQTSSPSDSVENIYRSSNREIKLRSKREEKENLMPSD